MIEIAIDTHGRKWTPRDVVFTSVYGQFCVTIYAFDYESERTQLQALKATGRVEGEILDEIPA